MSKKTKHTINLSRINHELSKLSAHIPEYHQLQLQQILAKIKLDAAVIADKHPVAYRDTLYALEKLLSDLNNYFDTSQHSKLSNIALDDIVKLSSNAFKEFNQSLKQIDRGQRFFRNCSVFLVTTFSATIGAVVGTLAGVATIAALPISLGICSSASSYIGYKFGKWLTGFSSRQHLNDDTVDFSKELKTLLTQIEDPKSPLRFEKRLKAFYHSQLQLHPDIHGKGYKIILPNKDAATAFCQKLALLGITENNNKPLQAQKNSNGHYQITVKVKILKQFERQFSAEQNAIKSAEEWFKNKILISAETLTGSIGIASKPTITASLTGKIIEFSDIETSNLGAFPKLKNLLTDFGITYKEQGNKIFLTDSEFLKLQELSPTIEFAKNGFLQLKQDCGISTVTRDNGRVKFQMSSLPFNNDYKEQLCDTLQSYGIKTTTSDEPAHKNSVTITANDYSKLLKKLADKRMSAPEKHTADDADNYNMTGYRYTTTMNLGAF